MSLLMLHSLVHCAKPSPVTSFWLKHSTHVGGFQLVGILWIFKPITLKTLYPRTSPLAFHGSSQYADVKRLQGTNHVKVVSQRQSCMEQNATEWS